MILLQDENDLVALFGSRIHYGKIAALAHRDNTYFKYQDTWFCIPTSVAYSVDVFEIDDPMEIDYRKTRRTFY